MSLTKALDRINAEYGRDTVSFAASGRKRRWGLRSERRSQRFTTDWDELLKGGLRALGHSKGEPVVNIEILEEELDHLPAHGQISIAFEVRSILDLTLTDSGLGGFVLRERQLTSAYVKDYDGIDGNRPCEWGQRFDIANWALLSAWIDGRRAGGVVIAFKTQDLDVLERRQDLAVIWDLRVAPDLRGRGIGRALFAAAEAWAKARMCKQLKVETQNVNVAACRFYLHRGCILRAAYRGAYPGFPDEIQLLWFKDLPPREEAA